MPLEHEMEYTRSAPDEVARAFVAAWWGKFKSAPTHKIIAMELSQWGIETGHGKSMRNYNIGNIKSREGDGKDYVFFECNELLPQAQALRLLAAAKPRTDGKEGLDVKITKNGVNGAPAVVWFYPSHAACRFRAYDTLDLGAADYLALIHARFQKAWPFILSGDPDGYARALKAQGYYTADVEEYARAVRSIFAKYLKSITLLDLSRPVSPPEPTWHELTEEDRATTNALNALTLQQLTHELINEDFADAPTEPGDGPENV